MDAYELRTICPHVTNKMSTLLVDIRTVVRYKPIWYNGLILEMEVSEGEILKRPNVDRSISSSCRPSTRCSFYRIASRRTTASEYPYHAVQRLRAKSSHIRNIWQKPSSFFRRRMAFVIQKRIILGGLSYACSVINSKAEIPLIGASFASNTSGK